MQKFTNRKLNEPSIHFLGPLPEVKSNLGIFLVHSADGDPEAGCIFLSMIHFVISEENGVSCGDIVFRECAQIYKGNGMGGHWNIFDKLETPHRLP